MSSTVKKSCPVTLAQFAAAAGALSATLGDGPAADGAITVEPRQFSTGSIGLWGQGKLTATIGGKPVPCQVGATLTVVGSKAWPEERRANVLARLKAEPVRLYFGTGGAIAGTTMAPFSTGSFGWNVNAKLVTPQGDTLQVGINVTVIGSKEAARQ